MKKFTVLFVLLCFLTIAFSGVAFANAADNPPVIQIQQPSSDNSAAQNFNIEQKAEKKSFWVKNRYYIFGVIAGFALYNHNRHHHNGGSAPAPLEG